MPTRDHPGEWINYIGQVLIELMRASNLSYIAALPDNQIIYGFTELPLSYPNVYVIPISEPGLTPSLRGDQIELQTKFMIVVEGSSPDLVTTDDQLRLILGDIITIVLTNRPLTYNGNPTVRDTHIFNIDAEYLPPNEQNDIRRWVMMTIICNKKLTVSTVTS